MTDYGLDGRGSIASRSKTFLFHSVQTGSGVNPASCPMGNKDSFPGIKRPERETDHSHSYKAKVKNRRTIPPLSHLSSLREA
jgi:hypothetical protein